MNLEFWLRAVLLTGLVVHKALWETLKTGPRRRKPLTAVGVLKMLILAGFAIQTVLPPILPIQEGFALRAAGLGIYLLGLGIAITARIQLGDSWSDIEKRAVPADRPVVQRGLYGYVRHPIYIGDLLLVLGLELALNSWLVLGMLALGPAVILMALREEARLKRLLPGYADYCQRTWRFVPYIV